MVDNVYKSVYKSLLCIFRFFLMWITFLFTDYISTVILSVQFFLYILHKTRNGQVFRAETIVRQITEVI